MNSVYVLGSVVGLAVAVVCLVGLVLCALLARGRVRVLGGIGFALLLLGAVLAMAAGAAVLSYPGTSLALRISGGVVVVAGLVVLARAVAHGRHVRRMV